MDREYYMKEQKLEKAELKNDDTFKKLRVENSFDEIVNRPDKLKNFLKPCHNEQT